MEGHREKEHGLTRMSLTNPETVEDKMEPQKDIPREPRKVARKSTKPPRNPQESVVPSNQVDDNKVDDFARETFETPAESRKVAKKSTRPPRNPEKREDVEDIRECVQITEESKVVDDNEAEVNKDKEDVEIINEANCGVETTSETKMNESESGLDIVAESGGGDVGPEEKMGSSKMKEVSETDQSGFEVEDMVDGPRVNLAQLDDLKEKNVIGKIGGEGGC